MGKNTPERQDFIIENLRVEKDLAEDVLGDDLKTDDTTNFEIAS
jgi:topoisomerase-4 subunit B